MDLVKMSGSNQTLYGVKILNRLVFKLSIVNIMMVVI